MEAAYQRNVGFPPKVAARLSRAVQAVYHQKLAESRPSAFGRRGDFPAIRPDERPATAPAAATLSFAILFAGWAIASGIATIAAGLSLSNFHGRWWLLAGGVIAIIFGVGVLLDLELGMLVLSYLIGIQALLAGSTLLALAYWLRKRKVADGGDHKPGLRGETTWEANHG